MTLLRRLTALSALLALLGAGISGCIIAPDHGPYRYDHGDRYDRYNHREAHWCNRHHEDEHCR
jgi:hypothetical protein